MFGEDQRSHSHYCCEGREEDGCLVGVQYLLPGPVFVLQSVHNEDTEVIANTKDKGGQDDIDNVELNT